MLAGLLASALVGVTLDFFNPEYRRFSRGMSSRAAVTYADQVGTENRLKPAEIKSMLDSDNPSIRVCASVALSGTRQLELVPEVIETLRDPEVSENSLAVHYISKNLKTTTYFAYDNPKDWLQWWDSEGTDWLEAEVEDRRRMEQW